MLFSVLIPNYNNAPFLPKLFESILNQSYNNWEVIFNDDASTDNSIEVAKGYANLDNRIKIFQNNQNMGTTYTQKRCLELSDGIICGLIGSDDYLVDNAIELFVKYHLSSPKASLIYSNHFLCNEDLSKIEKFKYPVSEDGYELIAGFSPNHYGTFKREYYDKTLGIDVKFKRAIDRDLVLKLEEVGEVIHIPEYLYYYRVNRNSISNNHQSYIASYWAWVARFDACDRRGWDKAFIYDKIMRYFSITEHENCISKETMDYKLGNFILNPLRRIKRIIKNK
jgi:glycosyltransferase involved in cell wall biosynthesis